MVVHRELLSRVHHQELLCVLFRVFVAAQLVAVADRKQNETFFIKPAKSAVGHVPPQHVVPDLIIVVAFGLPVLRCPVSERRESVALLGKQAFHIFDYFIDKGTFHGHLLLDLNRIDRVNEESVFIIVNEQRAVHFHNECQDARLL